MASQKSTLDGLRIERDDTVEESRGKLWLLLVAVVLVLGAGLWFFFGRAHGKPVRVEAVHTRPAGTAGTVLNASGYVTARRAATVSSKITGKVTEVLIEEGMAVQSGQVLARLDDATPRKQYDLAVAQLDSARRSLAENEVRLKQTKLSQDRAHRLHDQGVSAQADVDSADADANTYSARLDLGRQDVVVAERQVAARRQDLDDTVIRAPFTGVAVTKDAQPGEMISPVSAGGGFTRTGICTLVDMASLEIDVDVNESYIGRVVAGQKAEAVLDAYPDWTIPAHVITTIPTADRQKATVKVRLAFEKLDPRILPDMGVKVAFLSDEPKTASAASAAPAKPEIEIPKAAVRQEGTTNVVFVLTGGSGGERVERRAVRLGAGQGDRAVVTSGLSEGDRVVVEGPTDLKDGDPVKLQGQG
jgi:RND family efflux transporter MFP subunit